MFSNPQCVIHIDNKTENFKAIEVNLDYFNQVPIVAMYYGNHGTEFLFDLFKNNDYYIFEILDLIHNLNKNFKAYRSLGCYLQHSKDTVSVGFKKNTKCQIAKMEVENSLIRFHEGSSIKPNDSKHWLESVFSPSDDWLTVEIKVLTSFDVLEYLT